MKKAAISIETIIIVILALIVLVTVVFIFTTATGKTLFPDLMARIKDALSSLERAMPKI